MVVRGLKLITFLPALVASLVLAMMVTVAPSGWICPGAVYWPSSERLPTPLGSALNVTSAAAPPEVAMNFADSPSDNVALSLVTSNVGSEGVAADAVDAGRLPDGDGIASVFLSFD